MPTKTKPDNVIQFPKAATINDAEFVGGIVTTLCDVADGLVCRCPDAEGWAFAALTLAAERARHNARQAMGPEDFGALVAEVEARVVAIREASVTQEERGVR